MVKCNYIMERIESKKNDYLYYDYSQTESSALATFFDLAQEFDGIEDFYCLCTAIPKAFFGLEARLYVIEARKNNLALAAKTEEDGFLLGLAPPSFVQPGERPYH